VNVDIKLRVLEQLYRLYEEVLDAFVFCCRHYCDSCCTRNVTLTTLEGIYILDHLSAGQKKEFLDRLRQDQALDRFVPRFTINQFADCCRRGGTPPEEEVDPGWTPCSLLKDSACTIYPYRPFGCRCLVSTTPCRKTGFAEIDPFVLAISNMFQQVIEHVDQQGMTGNLIDIMLSAASEGFRDMYTRNVLPQSANLVSNSALTSLMIPPEYRERIRPIMDAIQGIQA
jgi:hypothetical protein